MFKTRAILQRDTFDWSASYRAPALQRKRKRVGYLGDVTVATYTAISLPKSSPIARRSARRDHAAQRCWARNDACRKVCTHGPPLRARLPCPSRCDGGRQLRFACCTLYAMVVLRLAQARSQVRSLLASLIDVLPARASDTPSPARTAFAQPGQGTINCSLDDGRRSDAVAVASLCPCRRASRAARPLLAHCAAMPPVPLSRVLPPHLVDATGPPAASAPTSTAGRRRTPRSARHRPGPGRITRHAARCARARARVFVRLFVVCLFVVCSVCLFVGWLLVVCLFVFVVGVVL